MTPSILPQSPDVLVIGGGVVGLATTYHLAKAGAKVSLVTAGDIGDGASACNAGRTQVNEGNLDAFSLSVIVQSLERLAQLPDELGMDFGWRRIGYLCLISSEKEIHNWQQRCPALTAAGIPTEMMDLAQMRNAEPYLAQELLLGGAYTTEGLLDPFLYSHAFAFGARRLGARLFTHKPVTAMQVAGGRVMEVIAGGQRFTPGKVVVACGAWSGQVGALARAHIPVAFHHTEAFITEPLPPVVFNMIGIADFYEVIHSGDRAVPIGLGPYPNQTVLVAESVSYPPQPNRSASHWGLTALSAQLQRYYPSFGRFRVRRHWGTATPYSPDEHPILGRVQPLENLYTATGFQQTICITPVVTELLAQVVLEQEVPAELDAWSPARFMSDFPPHQGGGLGGLVDHPGNFTHDFERT
ncbi:MAG: FAD-binding oxidoreductase [Anaerolineae bacterium]|nr:FAD-binding oxidoreductase [Anaerolineae bacterium]